nr:hypothetical protein [Escherichia coli]
MQYQCMSTYCDIVSYTHFATKNGGITTNGHIMVTAAYQQLCERGARECVAAL